MALPFYPPPCALPFPLSRPLPPPSLSRPLALSLSPSRARARCRLDVAFSFRACAVASKADSHVSARWAQGLGCVLARMIAEIATFIENNPDLKISDAPLKEWSQFALVRAQPRLRASTATKEQDADRVASAHAQSMHANSTGRPACTTCYVLWTAVASACERIHPSGLAFAQLHTSR
eukprot:6196241-Pleurochrysis_carterae.AAC.2